MRIRTRSCAAAFAASAGVAGLSMHAQPTEALRSAPPPLFSSPSRHGTRTAAAAPTRSHALSSTRPRAPFSRCSCKASRTDTDTDASASSKETTTTQETIRIRRKSYGAPVVDSTLLRFISQQKKIPEVFRGDDGDNHDAGVEGAATPPEAAAGGATGDGATVARTNHPATGERGGGGGGNPGAAAATTISRNTPGGGGSGGRSPVPEPDPSIAATTGAPARDDDDDDAEDDASYASATETIKKKLTEGSGVDPRSSSTPARSWMAQFGSQNVAEALLESGGVTDRSVAKTAGDAVERYCVVRTARRRIRRFLRERDTLWKVSSSSSSDGDDRGSSSTSRSELESLAASDMATSPAASLLLSYAEQQQREPQANTNGSGGSTGVAPEGATTDNDDNNPSYGFGDVLAVMRDHGLTGNDIGVLLTHSPNLALRVPSKAFVREGLTDAAETLEETLERSLGGLLVGTLGLRRYDARKVLRTCPGLLSVRGSRSAVQVVAILTKLGVSPKSLARDKTSLPVLLSRSPSGLFRLVAFLSSTAVRMPLETIGPLLRRRAGRELMDVLLPVPNTSYSKAAGGRGVAETEAAAGGGSDDAGGDAVAPNATATDPATTTAASTAATTLDDDAATWSRTRTERQERIERTYSGMARTARILKGQIGTQELGRVVSAYPSVLLLDAEKQILPVARYLMGGLGIWREDLSGVLQLYPTLLGKTIEELERTVSYVLELGVEEDDLAGIFRAFPGLFSLPAEEMEAVVSYLESIGVRDVGAFVTKLPPVLGYSVEDDLRPKWEFLRTVCLQPEFELKEFPAYFSYPFSRVIKTRFNYLAYKGISIRFVSMRIDTVLRFGDADFATKVALDDDDGEAFRLYGDQRGSRDKRNETGPGRRGNEGNRTKKARKAGSTHRHHHNHHKSAPRNQRNHHHQNEARAALQAAERLSRDIDNAKNLADLNRSFREAMPLRNRSLGNSLPSLEPTRPRSSNDNNIKKKKRNNNNNKTKKATKAGNHHQNNSNNNGGANTRGREQQKKQQGRLPPPENNTNEPGGDGGRPSPA